MLYGEHEQPRVILTKAGSSKSWLQAFRRWQDLRRRDPAAAARSGAILNETLGGEDVAADGEENSPCAG